MSLLQTIKDVVLIRIHPKGKMIIAAVAAATLVLYLFSSTLGQIGLLLTIFTVYFFRDPHRITPQLDGAVLATGDGVVCEISESELPPELGVSDEVKYQKISIFLNVFNVHVNRIPATGKIIREVYVPGKFLNAAEDKASSLNERSVVMMETNGGDTIGFSQIAGFVARRIICQLADGDAVEQGARYGIIRFGSRCDIYVPKDYTLLVSKGSTTVGGETIVAMNKAAAGSDTVSFLTQ